MENIQLNTGQRAAVEKITDFIAGKDHVFILKGYAGTGKTTLIKKLVQQLITEKKRFHLCAPTGRAAQILRQKTTYGETIHSTIYDFQSLETLNEEKDFETQSYVYYFPIASITNQTIIIVDEASMVSSVESKDELISFGTNILLNDLLTFARLTQDHSFNKIIFIGDPAQLAPVGDRQSNALSTEFFGRLSLKVQEYTLTEVMRQKDNYILKNATKIRSCIENEKIHELSFDFDQDSFIDMNNHDLVEEYCKLFPVPSFDSGVIITYSNNQSLFYNKRIRAHLFPNQMELSPGDIGQVVANNYHRFPRKIYNGEFIQIVNVGGTVKQAAPVIVQKDGKSIKKTIEIIFRSVDFRIKDSSEDYSGYVIDSLLNSPKANLSIDESRAIYINCAIRFKEKHPKLKLNSDEFKSFIKYDPFFNALRIKYGYSITGHKSQGGEWKTIFVDYYGRVSLNNEALRWCYTATTRASETLFAVNYPNFKKFHGLSLSSITTVSKMPIDAFDYSYVPCSPFHFPESHLCKSWLFWNILQNIENTLVELVSVQSFPYEEQYIFKYHEQEYRTRIYHNAAGYFTLPFQLIEGDNSTYPNIQKIIEKDFSLIHNLQYKPTEEFIAELYSFLSDACEASQVQLTNVVENKESFYITFYLRTSNPISFIQFYFNGQKKFTKGLVKTFGTAIDQKLNALITYINEYQNL